MISLLSCKSLKESNFNREDFYTLLDNELKNFILNKSIYSANRKKHLLNNEIKFIINARKDFFSNINLIEKKEMNLVEIFDPEMPSSTYRAALKLDSKIYLFIKNDLSEIQFQEIQFESLKKENGEIACILLEMDKPVPNKINSGFKKGSYHFIVFVTKAKINGDIVTYMPDDICILE